MCPLSKRSQRKVYRSDGPAPTDLVSVERRIGDYLEHPSPPIPLSRLGRGGEGVRWALAIVANPPLHWGKPSGGVDT